MFIINIKIVYMFGKFTYVKSESVYVVSYVRILIYLLTFGLFLFNAYTQGDGALYMFAFY